MSTKDTFPQSPLPSGLSSQPERRRTLWSPLAPGMFVLLIALGTTACPGRLDSLSTFDTSSPNPLAFTTVDVQGRTLRVGMPSDEVQIMFFTSPATSDAMQPITAEIAIHFREAGDLDFVTIVDLRSLEFYERPFAPGAIRDAGRRTIGRINRALDAENYDPIEGLEEHLFMVTDDNGGVTDTYGVPDPEETLTVVVFLRSGQEQGRYDPVEQMEELLAGIEMSRDE